MSLLKQIDDKGAVLAWSPVPSRPNLVVLGTKDSAGGGFDDHGGELELHELPLSDQTSSSKLLGKLKANSRFSSIAWSKVSNVTIAAGFPMGIIAGGMTDGHVKFWNPAKLAAGDSEGALVATILQHQGAVNGIQFNPNPESSHLLATGGADGEIFVMDCSKPSEPNVCVPAPPPSNAKHGAEVTRVAWNTKVAHILASADAKGSTIIWDLRQKKAWCELKEPTGAGTSDIAWHPDQGLNIVTASGDDKQPVIKLWDLRSSASLPLATLQGHTEGILSISWCPNDPTLLLSCGKDNKTMMWDLMHLQCVYELPNDTVTSAGGMDAAMGFGALAANNSSKRHDISWSPCLPSVISTCSFDRRVQFYSLSGAKSKLGRAPKWLQRPCGATFGFGGKLASFSNKKGPDPTTKRVKNPSNKISQIVEDIDLISACDYFHASIASGDFKTFCLNKVNAGNISEQDKAVWSLMRVIRFEENAREELLKYLGFDSVQIAAAAESLGISKATETPTVESTSAPAATPEPTPAPVPAPPVAALENMGIGNTAEETADFFGSAPAPATTDEPSAVNSPPPLPPAPVAPVATEKVTEIPRNLPPQVQAVSNEMILTAIAGDKHEQAIRNALIVGNFSVAVDYCLEAGLMAEALLLAQCGEPALWNRTQEAFFASVGKRYKFLDILQAVIKSDLMNMVLSSDLGRWKETLAILSTYGKSEEFPSLCEALAGRLENELQDTKSATLCYMCAANTFRCVTFWVEELKQSNLSTGYLNTIALQQFVEKVVVFTQLNPNEDLGPECTAFFSQYAGLLASQGRLDIAAKYLKGEDQPEQVLRDRLYHAGTKAAGSRPPPFPFTKVNVMPPNPQLATGRQLPQGQQPQAAQPRGIQPGFHQQQQSSQRGFNPAAQPINPATTPQSATPSQQQGPGGLPPGWLQLSDPSSGRMYYVNQSTGQSQWEPPANISPTPSMASMPTTLPAMQQQQPQIQSQPQANPTTMGGGAGGFGSPVGSMQQQHPQYRQQQQPQQNFQQHQQQQQPQQQPGGVSPFTQPQTQPQIHTSQIGAQPAVTATQPAMTQQVATQQVATQPVATQPAASPASAAASTPQPLTEEPESVKALDATVVNLVQIVTSPADKRQLTMVQTSMTALKNKAMAGGVDETILEKLSHLVAQIQSKNAVGANQIQMDLVNTAWGNHKDWIKGLKVLIQLACKY